MKGSTITDKTGFETLEIISKADQFNKWTYETIKPYLKGEILEIGSGIGNISKFIIESGHAITLSDFNHQYFESLKKYTVQKNVRGVLTLDLQSAHYETNFGDLKQRFDTILLSNVIEHLKDEALSLEISRFLLKKDGNLIVLAPSYQGLYSRMDKELGHFRRYTREMLASTIKLQRFNIITSQYFNFLGIAGWWVSGKLLRQSALAKTEMVLFNRLVPLAKLLDRFVFRRAGLSTMVVAKKMD